MHFAQERFSGTESDKLHGGKFYSVDMPPRLGFRPPGLSSCHRLTAPQRPLSRQFYHLLFSLSNLYRTASSPFEFWDLKPAPARSPHIFGHFNAHPAQPSHAPSQAVFHHLTPAYRPKLGSAFLPCQFPFGRLLSGKGRTHQHFHKWMRNLASLVSPDCIVGAADKTIALTMREGRNIRQSDKIVIGHKTSLTEFYLQTAYSLSMEKSRFICVIARSIIGYFYGDEAI